jgi:hypothetical protein
MGPCTLVVSPTVATTKPWRVVEQPEAAGFKKSVRSDLTLNLQDRLSVDTALS